VLLSVEETIKNNVQLTCATALIVVGTTSAAGQAIVADIHTSSGLTIERSAALTIARAAATQAPTNVATSVAHTIQVIAAVGIDAAKLAHHLANRGAATSGIAIQRVAAIPVILAAHAAGKAKLVNALASTVGAFGVATSESAALRTANARVANRLADDGCGRWRGRSDATRVAKALKASAARIGTCRAKVAQKTADVRVVDAASDNAVGSRSAAALTGRGTSRTIGTTRFIGTTRVAKAFHYLSKEHLRRNVRVVLLGVLKQTIATNEVYFHLHPEQQSPLRVQYSPSSSQLLFDC
jgi:hypothetical protein